MLRVAGWLGGIGLNVGQKNVVKSFPLSYLVDDI